MNKEQVLKRNNVKISGEGTRPMLFAHGFGCDQNMWRFVAPSFEKNYQVILFDFVGCGKSDKSAYSQEKYSSLNGYAQDVLDICGSLELSNVIFVGHSVSSMIGLLAAIEVPHFFSQLVMIGPSPRYVNDGTYIGGFERSEIEVLLDTMEKNYPAWVNSMAPLIMKNPERPELAHELADSFCATDPVIFRQFAKVTFYSDNRKDLPKLNKPVLILQCSDDLIAPYSAGEYVSKNIPHSKMMMMKATGHCPHLSHPEETIAVMKEYLNY